MTKVRDIRNTYILCELKISSWCKKTIKEKNHAIINGKACCINCYNLQKILNKEKENKKKRENGKNLH